MLWLAHSIEQSMISATSMQRARRATRAAGWLAAALCACAAASARESAELEDVTARVLYAFYTADTRTLRELQDVLSAVSVDASLNARKQYYQGLAQLKLADLEARSADTRAAATKAAQHCEQYLQNALAADPRSAEAQALAALCGGFTVTLKAGEVRQSYSCQRSRPLRTALELAPTHPRVLLADYLCRFSAQNDPHGLMQLQAVVSAFDQLPPQANAPSWGYAESLMLLGQALLQRGDILAAREALERALILAPDYQDAQRLLGAAVRE